MKLQAKRNFWMTDRVTGRHITRKEGDFFEMDPSDDGEEIYLFLQSGSVTISDEQLIPKSGKYTVAHPFSYQTQEGFQKQGIPGSEITLPQALACQFLVSGHIKPVDESAWIPKRLLGPIVKENQIKTMFDPEPVKMPWIRRG